MATWWEMSSPQPIVDLEQRLGLYPIGLQPEGTTPEHVLAGMRWLADHALLHGWHLSGRLHALLREPGRADTTPQDTSVPGQRARRTR